MRQPLQSTLVGDLPIGTRFTDPRTGAEVELVGIESAYCVVKSCCDLEADFYCHDPAHKRHLLLPAGLTFYVNPSERLGPGVPPYRPAFE